MAQRRPGGGGASGSPSGRGVDGGNSGGGSAANTGTTGGGTSRPSGGASGTPSGAGGAPGSQQVDLVALRNRPLPKTPNELAKNVNDFGGDASKSVSAKDAGMKPNRASDVAPPKDTPNNVKDGETPDSALRSAWRMVENNPGKTIAGLAVATAVTIALVNKKKSEETPRTITKIESANFFSKKKLKITFTPAIRITSADLITFKGTRTTPSLDVTDVNVSGVVSDTVIIYDSPANITSMTPGGQILVKTTFLNQIGDLANQASGGIGSMIASALGIPPDWVKWVASASCSSSCCCLILLLGLVFMMET